MIVAAHQVTEQADKKGVCAELAGFAIAGHGGHLQLFGNQADDAEGFGRFVFVRAG